MGMAGKKMWYRVDAICEGYVNASQALISFYLFCWAVGTWVFILFASLNSTYIFLYSLIRLTLFALKKYRKNRTTTTKKGKEEGQ